MTVVFMSQVTLSKEGSSGDYSLEAGALVLGDQGRFITAHLFRLSLKVSFPSPPPHFYCFPCTSTIVN